MSDDPVRTIGEPQQGALPFPHDFAEEQCRPVAGGIRFDIAEADAEDSARIRKGVAEPLGTRLILGSDEDGIEPARPTLPFASDIPKRQRMS